MRVKRVLFAVFLVASIGMVTFSDELQRRSNHPHPPQEPERTLLIIQGAYRTFDAVVDSIVKNLILANEPCEVIVSLDQPPPKLSVALEKLRPFLLSPSVVYPNESEVYLGTRIEFAQQVRALKAIESQLNNFKFLMKTRTDVMVKQSFRFTAVSGHGHLFPDTFQQFVESLMPYKNIMTACDVLLLWFMCAGNFYFARTMFNPNHLMAWSPVGPYAMIPELYNHITQLCNEGEEDTWALLRDAKKMQTVVKHLFQKHHVMFVVGNTWIGFGRRDDFLPVYNEMFVKYGNLSWNTYHDTLWHGDKWPVQHPVTESIFRIAHLNHNKSLVDIFNKNDHTITFSKVLCYGLDQLSKPSNDGIAVFIVRAQHISCTHTPSVLPDIIARHNWTICARPRPPLTNISFSVSQIHNLGNNIC